MRVANIGEPLPNNIIMMDLAPRYRDESQEEINYNEHKEDFSQKVYRINELRFKSIGKAISAIEKNRKVIEEYMSLVKQIYGE